MIAFTILIFWQSMDLYLSTYSAHARLSRHQHCRLLSQPLIIAKRELAEKQWVYQQNKKKEKKKTSTKRGYFAMTGPNETEDGFLDNPDRGDQKKGRRRKYLITQKGKKTRESEKEK